LVKGGIGRIPHRGFRGIQQGDFQQSISSLCEENPSSIRNNTMDKDVNSHYDVCLEFREKVEFLIKIT